MVYGPDHEVVKATSPKKEAAVLDLGGTYIAEADYDDENKFGDEEDDDVSEVMPTASVAERKEARKEEILTGVSAQDWQEARLRINNHERLFCRVQLMLPWRRQWQSGVCPS